MPEITLHTSDLSAALTWAGRAIPARPVLPVLAGVLLTHKGSNLTVVGQDAGEVAAMTVHCAGDGKFGKRLLPGKLLMELARAVPTGDVRLHIEEGADDRVTITAGRSSFRVPLMPVKEYPTIAAAPTGEVVLSGRALADAVKSVAIAAGKEDALPALSAVEIEVSPENGTITLVSTDRYRLARHIMTYEAPDPTATAWEAMVPAKDLEAAVKLLAGDAEVTLSRTEGTFGLATPTRWVTTRVIDGEFPKWKQLLDGVQEDKVARVDAAELIGAVKRAALISEAGTPVVLTFDPVGELTVAMSSGANTSSEAMPCAFDGEEEFRIGFNHSTLSDALATVGDGETTIGLLAPNKPALLSGESGADTYVHLLMPQRLNEPR